jgi:uncharacterized repeat protein (TIGR01451 family)
VSGRRTSGLIALLAWALLGVSPPAGAVDNTAIGGLGGINNGTLLGGDGTGPARIGLIPVDLALVKEARDVNGAVLPAGSNVAPGQEIWFVLYVDNTTSIPADDVRIVDALDESQFTYVPGTLSQTQSPSGSSSAALWAGAWTPRTDAVGAPDDVASITNTGGPAGADRLTIGADPSQTNQRMDLPPSTLRAVRFRVKVN